MQEWKKKGMKEKMERGRGKEGRKDARQEGKYYDKRRKIKMQALTPCYYFLSLSTVSVMIKLINSNCF